MMPSQVVGAFILILGFSTVLGNRAILLREICAPHVLEEMPPRIREMCDALENSEPFANALNNYIKNEAPALFYKTDDLLAPNNGKRTDAEHVFLRFGRRI